MVVEQALEDVGGVGPPETGALETGALDAGALDAGALDVVARDALRAHDVGSDARLTLLSVSENATFRVDDPDGGPPSVLRVHRPGYHSLRAIHSELAWVRALRADGVVATPAVIPALDGSLVVSGHGPGGEHRHAVRFAWVEGTEPAGEGLAEHFRTLGVIAARLHRHARGWNVPPGFTRLRWDVDTSIGSRGHWGRWQDGLGVGAAERALLERTAAVLRARLERFGTGPERFGLVHADMRLANLLVVPGTAGAGGAGDGACHDDGHGDGACHGDRAGDGAGSGGVSVIDFDDCGFGWFLYDLAASLSFIEHDPRVPSLVEAWKAGYRNVAPLGAAEEAEVETFVMLRRLLLVAWIGSHQDAPLARELGVEFTRVSCDLAEKYLVSQRVGVR